MKYKSIILIIFLISLFSLSQVHAKTNDLTLLGKIIYLDPGHGGIDSGATSGKYLEKNLNLEITKKLATALGKKGAIVYLTRDGDYDLSDNNYSRKRSDLSNRARLINESNCDLYLSIHLNSSTDTSWRGIQVFYNNINSQNKEIATIMTNTIKQITSNIKNLKEDNNYYMYKQITVPGILIELGFISNKDDLYLLKQNQYQEKLAQIITKGIENYFQK